MDFKGFSFRHDETQWQDKQSFDEFQTSFLSAASNSSDDLYNAIAYLSSADLVSYTRSVSTASEDFRNFRLSAKGFDLIEGVERSEDSTKSQFNVTFNFKLDSLMKIDSILKTKFNIGLLNQ